VAADSNRIFAKKDRGVACSELSSLHIQVLHLPRVGLDEAAARGDDDPGVDVAPIEIRPASPLK
jgi:hypothetical protein